MREERFLPLKILTAAMLGCLPVLPVFASAHATISLPPEARKFVEAATRPIVFEFADLNRDGRDDAILILEELREPGEPDWSGRKRTLLLLTRTGSSDFVIQSRSTRAIPEDDCGRGLGDCFEGIVAQSGTFSITLYGGGITRWNHVAVFRYSETDEDWFLSEYTDSSFVVGEGDISDEKRGTCLQGRDFDRISLADYSRGDLSWCEKVPSR